MPTLLLPLLFLLLPHCVPPIGTHHCGSHLSHSAPHDPEAFLQTYLLGSVDLLGNRSWDKLSYSVSPPFVGSDVVDTVYPRAMHTAVVGWEGKWIVFWGGVFKQGAAGNPLSSYDTLHYDVLGNEFTRKDEVTDVGPDFKASLKLGGHFSGMTSSGAIFTFNYFGSGGVQCGWLYYPSNDTWSLPHAQVCTIPGRASAIDSTDDVLYSFGGKSGGFVLDSFSIYDIDSGIETSVSKPSSCPSSKPVCWPPAREDSMLEVFPVLEVVFLFGGVGSSSTLGDVWTFSTLTYEWSELTFDTSPDARSSVAHARDLDRGLFFVFGGVDDYANKRFSDLWAFYGVRNEWIMISDSTSASYPPARSHATLSFISDRLYLFGGIDDDSLKTAFTDLWVVDLEFDASSGQIEMNTTSEFLDLVADDPDNRDSIFSVGDTVDINLVSCDNETLPSGILPDFSCTEDIDRYWNFSQPLGRNYSGTWWNHSTLRITILETDNSPDAVVPEIGKLHVSVLKPIYTPCSLNYTPGAVAGPLRGDWGITACGDGILQYGDDETCDDGNFVSGDGCNATCAVEDGYHCDGVVPTVCQWVNTPPRFTSYHPAPEYLIVNPKFASGNLVAQPVAVTDTEVLANGSATVNITVWSVAPSGVNITLFVPNSVLAGLTSLSLTYPSAGSAASAAVSFTANISDANTALQALRAIGDWPNGLNINTTLYFRVDDRGTAGYMSNGIASLFVDRSLTLGWHKWKNAPPSVTLPSEPAVTKLDRGKTAAPISPVSINDPDAGESAFLNVTVSSEDPSLVLLSWEVYLPGGGTALSSPSSTVNMAGNISSINAALGSLKVVSVSGIGETVVFVNVSDLGNTGSYGGVGEAGGAFPVHVVDINDAPIVQLPDPAVFIADEDVATILHGISVKDIDAFSGVVNVTLYVHGAGPSVLVSTDGAEPARSLVLLGTMEVVKNKLASLTVVGESNFEGNATVSVVIDDLGNTGTGGNLTDSGDFVVVVRPVVDETTLVVLSQPTPAISGEEALFEGSATAGKSLVAVNLTVPLDRDVNVTCTALLARLGATVAEYQYAFFYATGTDGIRSADIPIANDNVTLPRISVNVTCTPVVTPPGEAIVHTSLADGSSARSVFFDIRDDDEIDIRILDLTVNETADAPVDASLAVEVIGKCEQSAITLTCSVYTIVTSSATAGEDFSVSSFNITIPALATGKLAPAPGTITILNDSLVEIDETFSIICGDPVPAISGACGLQDGLLNVTRNIATVTIRDTSLLDGSRYFLVGFAAANASLWEGSAAVNSFLGVSAGTPSELVIVRPFEVSQIPLSVAVNFTDGTASSPGDFDSSEIVVNFEYGALNATVPLFAVLDGLCEPDETFIVTIARIVDDRSNGRVRTASPSSSLPPFASADVTIENVIDVVLSSPSPPADITESALRDGGASITISLRGGQFSSSQPALDTFISAVNSTSTADGMSSWLSYAGRSVAGGAVVRSGTVSEGGNASATISFAADPSFAVTSGPFSVHIRVPQEALGCGDAATIAASNGVVGAYPPSFTVTDEVDVSISFLPSPAGGGGNAPLSSVDESHVRLGVIMRLSVVGEEFPADLYSNTTWAETAYRDIAEAAYDGISSIWKGAISNAKPLVVRTSSTTIDITFPAAPSYELWNTSDVATFDLPISTLWHVLGRASRSADANAAVARRGLPAKVNIANTAKVTWSGSVFADDIRDIGAHYWIFLEGDTFASDPEPILKSLIDAASELHPAAQRGDGTLYGEVLVGASIVRASDHAVVIHLPQTRRYLGGSDGGDDDGIGSELVRFNIPASSLRGDGTASIARPVLAVISDKLDAGPSIASFVGSGGANSEYAAGETFSIFMKESTDVMINTNAFPAARVMNDDEVKSMLSFSRPVGTLSGRWVNSTFLQLSVVDPRGAETPRVGELVVTFRAPIYCDGAASGFGAAGVADALSRGGVDPGHAMNGGGVVYRGVRRDAPYSKVTTASAVLTAGGFTAIANPCPALVKAVAEGGGEGGGGGGEVGVARDAVLSRGDRITLTFNANTSMPDPENPLKFLKFDRDLGDLGGSWVTPSTLSLNVTRGPAVDSPSYMACHLFDNLTAVDPLFTVSVSDNGMLVDAQRSQGSCGSGLPIKGNGTWGTRPGPRIVSSSATFAYPFKRAIRHASGDSFLITFDEESNMPPVAETSDIDKWLSFNIVEADVNGNVALGIIALQDGVSSSLGANITGTWSNRTTLVVTIVDPSGTPPEAAAPADETRGIFVAISVKGHVRSVARGSLNPAEAQFEEYAPISLPSSINSHVVKPTPAPSGPGIVRVVAKMGPKGLVQLSGDNFSRLQDGATLTVTFDRPTNRPDISTTEAISSLFVVEPSVHGVLNKGRWIDAQTAFFEVTTRMESSTAPKLITTIRRGRVSNSESSCGDGGSTCTTTRLPTAAFDSVFDSDFDSDSDLVSIRAGSGDSNAMYVTVLAGGELRRVGERSYPSEGRSPRIEGDWSASSVDGPASSNDPIDILLTCRTFWCKIAWLLIAGAILSILGCVLVIYAARLVRHSEEGEKKALIESGDVDVESSLMKGGKGQNSWVEDDEDIFKPPKAREGLLGAHGDPLRPNDIDRDAPYQFDRKYRGDDDNIDGDGVLDARQKIGGGDDGMASGIAALPKLIRRDSERSFAPGKVTAPPPRRPPSRQLGARGSSPSRSQRRQNSPTLLGGGEVSPLGGKIVPARGVSPLGGMVRRSSQSPTSPRAMTPRGIDDSKVDGESVYDEEYYDDVLREQTSRTHMTMDGNWTTLYRQQRGGSDDGGDGDGNHDDRYMPGLPDVQEVHIASYSQKNQNSNATRSGVHDSVASVSPSNQSPLQQSHHVLDEYPEAGTSLSKDADSLSGGSSAFSTVNAKPRPQPPVKKGKDSKRHSRKPNSRVPPPRPRAAKPSASRLSLMDDSSSAGTSPKKASPSHDDKSVLGPVSAHRNMEADTVPGSSALAESGHEDGSVTNTNSVDESRSNSRRKPLKIEKRGNSSKDMLTASTSRRIAISPGRVVQSPPPSRSGRRRARRDSNDSSASRSDHPPQVVGSGTGDRDRSSIGSRETPPPPNHWSAQRTEEPSASRVMPRPSTRELKARPSSRGHRNQIPPPVRPRASTRDMKGTRDDAVHYGSHHHPSNADYLQPRVVSKLSSVNFENVVSHQSDGEGSIHTSKGNTGGPRTKTKTHSTRAPPSLPPPPPLTFISKNRLSNHDKNNTEREGRSVVPPPLPSASKVAVLPPAPKFRRVKGEIKNNN